MLNLCLSWERKTLTFSEGQPLAYRDLQIAATAWQHSLELVTGNLKYFSRVPGLNINRVLSKAKTDIYKKDDNN